jgi:integrase
MKHLTGFRYNAKTKVAKFEVILAGSGGWKRRRLTVAAKDAVAATTAYHKFRKEVADGEKGPAVPQTFRWFWETYWPRMKAGLSEKGREGLEGAMKSRILPRVGELLLEKINDAELGDFVASMREAKYAPDTINGSLSIIRKFLRDAVAREVIDRYPLRRRLPRQKVELLRLELKPEGRAAFLGAFDDEAGFRKLVAKETAAARVERIEDRRKCRLSTESLHGAGRRPDSEATGALYERFRELRPVFIIALETGLRHGDLLALKWSSVDLKNDWIRLTMEKTRAEATIPLSKLCRAALEECRARLDTREEGKGEGGVVVELRRRDPKALVLVDEDGEAVKEARVESVFKTAKKLAGITRRFRFHDMRHTFASTLASQGVSLQVIARALGHTTTKMSERYARPSEEAIQKAADALDRANNSLALNSSAELVALPAVKRASEGGAKPLIHPGLYGEPSGTRTQDPLLKRQVL